MWGSHKLAKMEKSTWEIKYTQCEKAALGLQNHRGSQIDTGFENREKAVRSETHV